MSNDDQTVEIVVTLRLTAKEITILAGVHPELAQAVVRATIANSNNYAPDISVPVSIAGIPIDADVSHIRVPGGEREPKPTRRSDNSIPITVNGQEYHYPERLAYLIVLLNENRNNGGDGLTAKEIDKLIKINIDEIRIEDIQEFDTIKGNGVVTAMLQRVNKVFANGSLIVRKKATEGSEGKIMLHKDVNIALPKGYDIKNPKTYLQAIKGITDVRDPGGRNPA